MGCSQSTVKIDASFYPIGDNYRSLRDLQQGLKRAGLESSELIVGVDFTKSNIYNGLKSFNTKSLHATYEEIMNPYQFGESIHNSFWDIDSNWMQFWKWYAKHYLLLTMTTRFLVMGSAAPTLVTKNSSLSRNRTNLATAWSKCRCGTCWSYCLLQLNLLYV